MKNMSGEITLSFAESHIERQSLLRIIRRFEGDESMKRRMKSSLEELRRAVEWNLMGRPMLGPTPQN